MKPHPIKSSLRPRPLAWTPLAASLALGLTACGGGSDPTSSASQGTAAASTAGALSVSVTAAAPAIQATPAFHMLPVTLDTPTDVDSDGSGASARAVAHRQTVPAAALSLNTAGLTIEALQRHMQHAAASAQPMAATPATSSVFTPAQIRAAYGMPTLPTLGSTPTASVAASMGAGQTVYIVDANHAPNALADLNAFSQKFGLPTCTSMALPTSTKLPLAAASSSGNCSFGVAYATANGTLSATAPAYDSGWASEISLDVQWVHATAPMARIILIEAPDASLNSLLGAVNLANAMGPGVVSMSFGAGEGSYTAAVDSSFSAANMTYVAATGDSGHMVGWPSVSPHVLAVGGTTLTYSGTGTRSETTWSGTGGGISAYTATPSYQSGVKLPTGTALSMRGVADVAFNADPYSGQYVAITAPGGTSPSWYAFGGTSLATPQWAALIAVANAVRASGSKAPLGQLQPTLYSKLAPGSTAYAGAFADVHAGNDGTCSVCAAGAGYDLPTGLGTPNVASLLPVLAATTGTPPPLPAATLAAGKVGTPYSVQWPATDAAGALTYTLTGAPSAMVVNSAGLLSWAAPVAGNYSFTLSVKDPSGQQASETVTLSVTAPAPVTMPGGSLSGKAGVAFSASLGATQTGTGALTYTLANAPSGLTVGSTGTLSWAKPVAGSYTFTATAKNAAGASATGTYTLQISAATTAPPTITGMSFTGSGTGIAGTVTATDPNGAAMTFTLAGAPSGMTMTSGGAITWSKPVRGTYVLTVTVTDSLGAKSSATFQLTIA